MAQNLPASQNHRSLSGDARTRSLLRGATAASGASAASARRVAAVLFAMLAAALLSCAIAIARPLPAHAESFTIPSVNIAAQAETDGSLNIIDQRTFSFEGSATVVKWTLNELPSDGLTINSVRVAAMSADGQNSGYPQVLSQVPFVLSWRDGGGPGRDAYSYDQARNTVYVFFGATDEQRLIELDYTVANGVTAYSDIGEVSWRFIDGQWGVDSENVTLTVSLPVPSGAEVVPGDNVRAWGHGPADGVVEANDDGSVVYEVPRVPSDSFAEARVIFPSDWLVNLPSGTAQPHRTEIKLPSVLSEEEAWADQGNRGHSLSLAYIVGCALVCAAALLIGLVAYLRHGKERVPAFKDEYWRSVPGSGIHPALIGRLWRWGHGSSDDFVATVMRLTNLGAVEIVRAASSDGEGRGGFALVRRQGARAATDPLDAKALEILFDLIADGGDTLAFERVAEFGKQRPREFNEAMDAWQKLLSDRFEEQAFIERMSRTWQVRALILAGVAAVVALASWAASGSYAPLAFGALAVIGLILLGNYMPRRSVEGNELCAKCKALRNWLRDLEALDEPLASDAGTWGELMVYAYLFGVSDEALRGLKRRFPLLIEAEAEDRDGAQERAQEQEHQRPDTPHYPWLPWHDASPVAGSAAFQTAVSRPTAKREGV